MLETQNIKKYISGLEKKVTFLQQTFDSSCQTNQILIKRLLIAQDALEFYADDKNYHGFPLNPETNPNDLIVTKIELDEGEIANAALNAINGKKSIDGDLPTQGIKQFLEDGIGKD